MSSYVYFKFKSQKEPQRVTIDGPHTDVWNLKREIITLSRLGDGTDFDLKIYKENSNEEYTDDTEIIPKDSTVLARRLPASAPGKGRAARYVSGKPPISAKSTAIASTANMGQVVDMDKAMTEEERLKAMFKFTEAQWQQKQEEMSHETRVPIQGGKPFSKKANIPEGEPPNGYICYRCGKKGHWIQACPTNDDAAYDNKSRIKRTTGIPRSMLKKIDQSEIDNLDDAQRQNLMINAEGEYVFAQADEKAWRKHLEQVKASEAAQQKAQQGNQNLRERGLECSIDKRLFVDPMKTPCCGKTYCHDCIENALLENDLTCPGCDTENVSLERLEPDEDMKAKIKAFQAEKPNEDQASRSPTVAAATPQGDASPRPVSRAGSKSPVSTASQARKRSADEVDQSENSNDKLQAPAMKRQKSSDQSKSPLPTESADDTELVQSNDNDDDNTNNLHMNMNMNMNMMPPDMSQMMQNMGMNFPMGMPFMGMPGMINPNMNMNMMNMMNMGMGMPMMGGMPNMNFSQPNFNNNNNNNYSSMNNAGGYNQGYGNNHHNNNYNNNQNRYGNKPFRHNNNNSQHQQPPTGMAGVPTGPKALQNQNATGSGATGNKFPNQQRHTGNEEDNSYIRQPMNQHRPMNRRGRGRGGYPQGM